MLSKPGRPGIVVIAQLLPANSPKDIIKVSKNVRTLLGLVLGDRVSLSRYQTSVQPAISVSVGTLAQDSEELQQAVKTHLKDTGLVVSGLSFFLNGNDFTIVNCGVDISKLSLDTQHDTEFETITQPYIFNASSAITFTSKMEPEDVTLPSPINFASIGGLSKQINILQSKIKLPLHYPHLFSRFKNSSPDKGFLLHGPPGTGKTMLLRAIANEMDAHVLTINGPSIVSKYLGETEEALRNVFLEANKFQPSIIFIDELDALVPKRGSDDSGEAESRVVSTLLTLMDGMHEKHGAGKEDRVIVVGATNRPNNIDAALRRAGRFGQEIEIGIPDADDRLNILQLQLNGMPHKLSKEYIEDLASKKMHGYVGADIQSLISQCVGLAVDRAIEQSLELVDMFIVQQDVEKSILEIRPSAMKEIVLETPKVYWTDIGGQELVKQKLKETVDWPLSHPDTFKRLGVQPPKGILLYGPPGCSKTLTAKALATEAGLNFLAVKGPELFNKYVGESERAVREVFRKARAAAPSIIFFDEIDALSSSRDTDSSSSDRVLTSLLNEMDGIETLVGVIVLAATNRPDVIDAALMRPGRLDRLIYVGPPDFAARAKILEIQFGKMTVNKEEVDIEQLARQTEGCSGAEIVQFTQEAGLLAMNESLEIQSVCARHFEKALLGIKRGITAEMLEYYENYDKQGRLE